MLCAKKKNTFFIPKATVLTSMKDINTSGTNLLLLNKEDQTKVCQ